MRRGIVIKGLKTHENVSLILEYANSLLAIEKYFTEEINGRIVLNILFVKENDELFNIARKIRMFAKTSAEVKYIKNSNKEKRKISTQNYDSKEWGNPFLKESEIEATSSTKPQNSPSLRIDLDFNDVDSFFEFLKSYPINCQTKERYSEPLSEVTKNDNFNDDISNRTTFVATNVIFDTDEIEVYVNNKLSSDVACRVEEKSDAYILHLFYKATRQYSKSVFVSKDIAQEPIQRIRYNEEESEMTVNGKNLGITFEGYDAYRRHKREEKDRKTKPFIPIKYDGKPVKTRKTALMKQTKVKSDSEQLVVSISESSKTSESSSREYSNDTNNIVKSEKTPQRTLLYKLWNYFRRLFLRRF